MTSRNSSNRRESGFTLLEILIVVVILGMMAGLIVARGPLRSPTLDVRSAASTLAQSLRVARAQAVATNRPVTLVLDTAAHDFRVGELPLHRLSPSVTLAAVFVSDETAPGGTVGGIRFEPDGSSTGGRIALAEGGRHLYVDVDWLTGRVNVADAN